MKIFTYAGVDLVISDTLATPLANYLEHINEVGLTATYPIPYRRVAEESDDIAVVLLVPGVPFMLRDANLWLADPRGTPEAVTELAEMSRAGH